MNAGFTLAQARARVDYFAMLGVSHLYLSPIFAARRGSMHGYDVVDPARVNPEIGTESELRVLSQDLHRHGMGLVIDIVPNHMGIGPENSYWDDVLTYGERSRYAQWFDIDWTAGHGPHRTLTLPVLADELETVLGRGELSIELVEAAGPRIKYLSHSFPLDPASLPPDLQLAQVDPEEARELADVYSTPRWQDRLRALLDAQHYRLEFWRRGPRDINYRRFFDVNDLAALRMEDPRVFAETHVLALRLVREGTVDGLRVDHVDGLLDPTDYLARLRSATSPETLIFVEKILSPGEAVPSVWPVQGTTGYEFLNDLEDTFVDPVGFGEIERTYRRMRRLGRSTYQEIARKGKTTILRGPLYADVERLVALLTPPAVASQHRWPADHMAIALTDFIAALPVYRTYIGADGQISSADRAVVEHTRGDAQALSAHPDIIAFIGDLVLGTPAPADPAARLHFVQRLQQVSAPAAAKGVEDTALYDYVPLSSRNEVGGGPERALGNAVGRLHDGNQRRAERHPLALLATNTHDTKRSADVRARLDALSQMPNEWEQSLRRWRELNDKHRRTVNGRRAPDANGEYLLYQTLVALWPADGHGTREMGSDGCDSVRERLTRYMVKASREAKIRTNWVNPDAAYEKVLEHFIAAVLGSDSAEFLLDVSRFARDVTRLAVHNALSRIAVHLTSPGTPDLYQGDELWNYALVDPDNRRQVDYDSRSIALAALAALVPVDHAILDAGTVDLFDDRVKLLVTHRLLGLRRTQPQLFIRGEYRPLAVHGRRSVHVIAFARSFEGQHVVTIAPRLACPPATSNTSEWWGDTTVELPSDVSATRWRQIITGDTVISGGMLEIARVLSKLPVSVVGS